MTEHEAAGAGRRPALVAHLLSPDPLDVIPRLVPVLLIPASAGPAAVVALALGYAVFVLLPSVYRSPWRGSAWPPST